MKTALYKYGEGRWVPKTWKQTVDPGKVQLILCFGVKEELKGPKVYQSIRDQFPQAQVLIGSTAGEIFQEQVLDDSVILVAMELEKTQIQTAFVNRSDYSSCYEAARALMAKLPRKDLKYVFALSDGSLVNGSELVRGIRESTDTQPVLVTGGLAGDGAQFSSTLTGLNSEPLQGIISLVGFYGNHLEVYHGSQGGWDLFGPERIVTRSTNNILYEIDGKNALALYKKYLGPEAAQLPGSALLFPLSIIAPGAREQVVRTILSIDEEDQSMTFAGDIPVGSRLRFMKANFDKITSAASEAAISTLKKPKQSPEFALLISCVGRKLILGHRIEEEVEAVREALGPDTLLAGFYSYGEISPFNEGGGCQLHNQTMTITTFHELP